MWRESESELRRCNAFEFDDLLAEAEIFDDLAFIPDMIAGGHDVDPEIEKLFGERRSDTEASRSIFAVGNDEIDAVMPAQFGETIFYDGSSGTAENVADKKNFQGSMVPR